jgi:hypothetical protein
MDRLIATKKGIPLFPSEAGASGGLPTAWRGAGR